MRWSFRFARVFGIDLKVHVTFVLILFWGAYLFRHFGAAGMAFGALLMALLFVCVTLHELGHSVVALRFGVAVRDIVLLPIGGIASLARIPEKPYQELLIAVAGPAVNVVIAAVLGLVLLVVPGAAAVNLGPLLRGLQPPSLAAAVVFLLYMNVVLVLFNLIPAFPLDGGRIFRSILAMFLPYVRATRIAASVGQVAAIGLGLLALRSGNIVLAFIAFFIFMAAGAESADVQARRVLSTLRVGDAYNRYALTLTLDDRVSDVVDYLLTSYQPDFAVVNRGRLEGVVTREDVLRWLGQNAYDAYVTELMHPDVFRVGANQSLEDVRRQLDEAGRRLAAVFEADAYLGLVSVEDIAEALTVLSFVRKQEGAGRRAVTVPGAQPPPPPPGAAGGADSAVQGTTERFEV